MVVKNAAVTSTVPQPYSGLVGETELFANSSVDAHEFHFGSNLLERQKGEVVAQRKGKAKRGSLLHFPPEVEEGNVEYKLHLRNCDNDRVTKLTSQMKWRLGEGCGRAIYLLGVDDDGTAVGISKMDMNVSIGKLKQMAKSLNCRIVAVEESKVSTGKIKTSVARVMIQENLSSKIPLEVRVVFLGEAECGKTTLVGVCMTDEADDGAGLARLHVLQHQHEIDRGHTSSVSIQDMLYDEMGQVVLEDNGEGAEVFFGRTARDNLIDSHVKRVSLIDVAGHPRFIKSTLYGLIALEPDRAFVVIDVRTLILKYTGDDMDDSCVEIPSMPPPSSSSTLSFCNGDGSDACVILATTINHLELCKYLGVPISIVVCKMDALGQKNISLEPLKGMVQKLLGRAGYSILERKVVPIRFCSNITKEGIEEIRTLVGETCPLNKSLHLDVCMYLREAYYVQGFRGVIVGGVLQSGIIKIGDSLKLGPDAGGNFYFVNVTSIRTEYGLSISMAKRGHSVTIGIRMEQSSPLRNIHLGESYDTEVALYQSFVRKGLCLLSLNAPENCSSIVTLRVDNWLTFSNGVLCGLGTEFVPDISKVYEFVFRAHTIKQRAVLTKTETIRAEQYVQLRFLHRPEYLCAGDSVMLQNGSILAVASVSTS
uniref:Elongation factor Tu, chloroplastic n=1 Tax=Mucochytrium quahogii TaxID=96639 RepID=A0A7S2R733_9STRA|mmetsp:Transcript_19935/g.32837  ORF Transcript_19935/g.32837 Transcript_19935/m.32837 type:complete len:651 (-) Transcript_19935:761-2713(-)